MSHCIANQPYRMAHAPIVQGRVEYSADMYTIFLDKDLKKIAPNSYEFLSHWGKKSISIAQKGFSRENEDQIQKNSIKQGAVSLAAFAASLSCYSMRCFPAALASLPALFLVSKLTSSANEQIKAKEIDKSLIEDTAINSEILKGGILFYKACQKVNQTKDRIFFTSSGESRFSALEPTPALKERITQIEKKIKDREGYLEYTEIDQEIIKKIVNLFASHT